MALLFTILLQFPTKDTNSHEEKANGAEKKINLTNKPKKRWESMLRNEILIDFLKQFFDW